MSPKQVSSWSNLVYVDHVRVAKSTHRSLAEGTASTFSCCTVSTLSLGRFWLGVWTFAVCRSDNVLQTTRVEESVVFIERSKRPWFGWKHELLSIAIHITPCGDRC